MRLVSLFGYAIVFGACCAATIPSRADVWEYDADGRIALVNGHAPQAIPKFAPSSKNPTAPAPNRYRELAETIAWQYAGADGVRLAGLDALSFTQLFCALIEQESRYDPRAVSPKGAQGLGQLMPGTAAQLGVADPFDPEENLHGALRYFVRQLEVFQDVDLALAAYNAGPHRVLEHGGIPPFRETRQYVARITNAAGLAKFARGPAPAHLMTASPSPFPTDRNISVWEF